MYNIVIVEDELIESESLHRIISSCVENVVIHEAATGKKAIQLIDTLDHIDMMFVDVNIPLPNGNQVIQYLKSKNTDTKVIVTTANDDFDIVRSMLNLKVDDYLLKPVKQSILIDTIHKLLEVNEADIATSKALKQKIVAMIERCDYAQWHSFLFKTLEAACTHKTLTVDQRKTVTNVLEILNQHVATQGEKLVPTGKKITALIQDITQHGLTSQGYYRTVVSMLAISEEVFDQALKNFDGNMDFTERAKFHIEKNILNNLTLDDIASKSFVSSCYLSRGFKKITGMGFSNYISSRKINIAKSLLQFSNLKNCI